MAAGELAGVERDRRDLGLGDADLDAPPGQPRVQRVVAGIEAQVGIGRHPGHPAAVQIRERRQRPHVLALGNQPVDGPTAQRAVRPGVGLLEPGVELVLVVAFVDEVAPRFEVGLQVALQALDGALGLRIAPPAEVPPDAQEPAERGELARRPPARRAEPGLAVPDQRARQAAQLP